MKKNMQWTDIWRKPFKYDHYGYIWDRDNVMTFTVDDLTEENDKEMAELCSSIVTALNGEEVTRKYRGLVIKDGCDLYLDGKMVGYFRGWGHLTGGLKMNSYQAAQVQDQLIREVLNKISDGEYIELQKLETDEEDART